MKPTTRRPSAGRVSASIRTSSETRDRHIAAAVFNQPWAIYAPKLAEIAAVVRRHMAGVQLTEQEIRAAIGALEQQPQPGRQGNAIIVIPVYGVLAYRMDMMTAVSGGTSLQRLNGLMEDAMGDASVSTIVLRFETPGGSVDGLTEQAAKIREMRGRGTKRIVAAIDVRALSAGYYLASQCDEVVCTPSGYAGAVGIVTEYCDDSEAMKMEGESIEVISIPAKKATLMQPGPLSDERRARLMDVMGQFYTMFVTDVAKGRGVQVARVKADYGVGDVLTAIEAKAAGMIDRIETFDATLSRLGTKRGAMVSVRAAADAVELQANLADGQVALEAAEHAIMAIAPQSEPQAEMVDPEDGECPDGYEMGEDDKCHLMPEEDAKATADATAQQATSQRNPPMTTCKFCGDDADECGGHCHGARAALNSVVDLKSRASLDLQQAAEQQAADQDALAVALALSE